ncbi:hypothetical protein [Niallia sp. NCCP-28]|nr:hypothetical protein [Niallia sp. NCCP-28]GKU81561.1 hypothetical protein NCCP28_09570 [Niallia sp. NCCP-28]
MKEKDKFACTYDESGADAVTAQVMDAYNDGAIDQFIQEKAQEKVE